MYRVIKVLNNNGILVYHVETGKEMILLGNGVGFGKKPTEQIEKLPGAKVYSLVTRRKQESVLKTVNGAKENRQLPNPFTPDIRVLFGEEYQVALKGRKIIQQLTGYEISEDEVGFITLHIHAGLSDEAVSQTLDATRIVNEGIAMIEQEFDQKLESGSLGCTRLMSHMYYMILRTRKGEGTNADFNDFIFQNYPRTGEAAKRVCDYMSRQLKQPVAKEEIGFLAIHIQRVISPDTV